jgi:hypothetical protein
MSSLSGDASAGFDGRLLLIGRRINHEPGGRGSYHVWRLRRNTNNRRRIFGRI